MPRTYLITGAGSGIGRATTHLLQSQGARVITVDISQADIQVDLGTDEGLRDLVSSAQQLAPDGLDGVIAAAGISDAYNPGRAFETLRVNFFGAVGALEGLRPLLSLSNRPRAVAICSTSALLPVDEPSLLALLNGDKAKAAEAIEANPYLAYMTSKKALALWLRRRAVSPEWAGTGILLNAVAPGVVRTPLVTPLLDDPAMIAAMNQSNPIVVNGHAEPEELAELIAFLASFESHYMTGQVIFMDGGTDALLRPDSF